MPVMNDDYGQGAGFDLELYKSLRREVVSYVEKIPALWLQKFILVGAVTAFLVTNHEVLTTNGAQGTELLVVAILAIPLLAALLDAKILEYSLHARAISRFITANFRSPEVLGKWEASLWGDDGEADIRPLVQLRSLVTVVVTAIPTIVLIVLAGLAIGELLRTPTLGAVFSSGGALIYVVATMFVWTRVWPGAQGGRER